MKLRFNLLAGSGVSILEITQADPFFYDAADSTNTSLTGRTGWTRAGDNTKADKIKSADGMFRMNTASNGDSPYGFQLTAAPTQYRRVSWGYNYTQQGGTLSNAATPYQYYAQQWVLAWSDISNYTFANVVPATGRLTIYKVVAGSTTELCRYEAVPTSGDVVLELTDRIRCFINGEPRVAYQLHGDATSAYPNKLFPAGTDAIRTGATGLRHNFYPSILATDWKVEELDMTVADPKPFYGRDTSNQRTITFTGTYSGTPVSWAYRLRRRSTGAVVKGWTAFSPTAGAGAWSADITVASGGPYLADFGWTDASDDTHVATSSAFAVGILVVAWGQSNALFLSSLGGNGAGYGGNDLVIGFNAFSTYVGSSFRRWMDELQPQSLALQPNMVGLAKSLSDATGVPVGVAAAGVSAQALATLKPGTTHWNNVYVPFITELGGNVEAHLVVQGEAEALASSDYSQRAADQALLVAGLRSIGGRSDAMVYWRLVGKDTGVANNSTTIARSRAVRSIDMAFENGVDQWISASPVGKALVDTIHFTNASHNAISRCEGMTIARRSFGALAYDGRGPLPTTASRVGAVITIDLDLNGAASVSGTALTGYRVSNDDFATTLTISTAEVVANKIVITLSGVPSGTVKVDGFPEPAYNDSSLALGTYTVEGITIPVFPIVNPITVT